MTARSLGAFEVESPEWRAARATRLGGSEIAAVVGLSPWQSRFSLFHNKKGLIRDQFEKPEMTWGKRLEPVIADAFLDRDYRRERLIGKQGATYVHADRDWQLASADLLLLPTLDGFNTLSDQPISILEVKTAVFGDAWSWGPDGSDRIPAYYRTQVLWYLDVLGLPYAYVAVLIAGMDYREYVIQADPDEQQRLRDAGEQFIADLKADVRPNLDEHTATFDAMRELHPQIDRGDTTELPLDLADRYCRAKAAAKAAEAEERAATTAVADVMGDTQKATFESTVIARRQARGTGLPYLVAGSHLPETIKEPAA